MAVVTIKEALILGFKTKGLRFYGRSGRAEFWYFYLFSCFIIGVSFKLNVIPVVGSLVQALVVLAIVACQFTATIRRLHDINLAGKIVAAPYVLSILYFVAMGPLNALYPEYSQKILDGLVTVAVLSYIYILFLCTRIGTKGNNRYGTDPLDKSKQAQDFINPDHMVQPEYLGDPWRKFKDKVAREKAKKAQANSEGNQEQGSLDTNENYISVPTPGQEPISKAQDTEDSSTKEQNTKPQRTCKERRKKKH